MRTRAGGAANVVGEARGDGREAGRRASGVFAQGTQGAPQPSRGNGHRGPDGAHTGARGRGGPRGAEAETTRVRGHRQVYRVAARGDREGQGRHGWRRSRTRPQVSSIARRVYTERRRRCLRRGGDAGGEQASGCVRVAQGGSHGRYGAPGPRELGPAIGGVQRSAGEGR